MSQPGKEAGHGREQGHRDQGRAQLVRAALTGRAAVVALVLLALHSVWRGFAVAQGFFTQQDYLGLRNASLDPLGVAYLTADHDGEFSPLGRLLGYVTVAAGGPEWAPAAVVIIVLQLVAGVLLWLLLSLLLPGRWLRIPLLAVALFTPVTLSVTLGWTSATTYLPGAVLVLVAALAVTLAVQHDVPSAQYVAAVAVLVCGLVSDRALVHCVALFFLAAALHGPSDLGVVARARSTLLGLRWVWVALAAAVALRVAGHVVTDFSAGYRTPTSFKEAFDTCLALVRSLAAGLVGGPWEGTVVGGALQPELQWTLALGILACVALAVPVLHAIRQPQVRLALLGIALTTVGVLTLLVLSSGGVAPSAVVARSAAGLVLPVLLLIAVAAGNTRALAGATSGLALASSAGRAVCAVLLAAALVGSSWLTARWVIPSLQNTDDRAYVEALRAGLATDPTLVLLDGPTPEGIMHPWFGEAARISTITEAFGEAPSFDIASEQLRMVGVEGNLMLVEVSDPVEAPAVGDSDCQTAVTQNPTTITFAEHVVGPLAVLSFDYLAPEGVSLAVEHAGVQVRVALPRELGSTQVPLAGGFNELTFVADGPGQICLARVEAGPVVLPGAEE